eukprot:TRINITY_DN5295_c0_g1_i1.p1 TRINITY_DN5295_c0_g1~~TRINITY_DN5295_c0_g1_i1.p1  ORF type:complete len:464 (-),score=96.42 TRINITY_DN5295_c0_g1_i1:438-1703(-)
MPFKMSLNIGIHELKDLRDECVPLQEGTARSTAPLRMEELYLEFTCDGRVLYECCGLIKPSGVDIMDCSQDVVLRLCVRRRMPQGNPWLYHLVIPAQVIFKHLQAPPHEWKTWIGLIPNSMMSENHLPDVLFTQSVHLISRPEFPKLLMTFRCKSNEFMELQRKNRMLSEREASRRKVLHEKQGRRAYEDVKDFLSANRRSSQPEPSLITSRSGGAHNTDESAVLTVRQREGFASAMRFVGSVRETLTNAGIPLAELPPHLGSPEAIMTSQAPGAIVDAHCHQLRQHLRQVIVPLPGAQHPGQPPGQTPPGVYSHQQIMERSVGSTVDNTNEAAFVEVVRMALRGHLDEAEVARHRAAGYPMVYNEEELASLRERFPALWDVCREVSLVVRDRSTVTEERNHFIELNRQITEKYNCSRRSR